MKVAVITDTNSGMNPQDAREHGIILLPMPVIIDGVEYKEHQDLKDSFFYTRLREGAEIVTSQPSAGDVIDLWKETLKEYDEIVHIPMSSGLSGSCQNAMIYAEEFGGKVQVVNNQRISVTQRQSALDAVMLALNGASAAEIREILERTRFESHIYIMVDTLTYLKKGGRVTPAAAMIAGVLNLKPVLQIQGEKLDAYSKCRGIRQAKKIMLDAVTKGVNEEFGGVNANPPGAWIGLAHTQNFEAAEEFRQEAAAHFPGFDIHVDQLPISIATHIGPGSLALTCTKVLPGGMQYK
ncbi:MAG: DegV family protein [Lachnospiraceae bacterium]|nr:DegV family protein [Lachnospiraceae bacterium]